MNKLKIAAGLTTALAISITYFIHLPESETPLKNEPIQITKDALPNTQLSPKSSQHEDRVKIADTMPESIAAAKKAPISHKKITLTEMQEAIVNFPQILNEARAGKQGAIKLLLEVINACTPQLRSIDEQICKSVPKEIQTEKLKIISDIHNNHPDSSETKVELAKEIINSSMLSMNNLGFLNIYTQDQAHRAVEKLAKASLEAGNVEGALILSRVYKFGIFGFSDKAKAYGYGMRAADLGHIYPPGVLEDLAAQLSPQQMATANDIRTARKSMDAAF